MKVVTIIDCFIQNENHQRIVDSSIQKMRSVGHPILLVSANVVDRDLQPKVDFFLYDSRNQLFEREDYVYKHPWHFWINCESFFSHNFYYSRQRHGLPVLINLFNSLRLAKSLGFTHFQRILYDMNPSQKCLDWISQIPKICESQNKRGLCYYNADQGGYDDLEGGYMFFEIDYFLDKVPQVGSEEDYRRIVLENKGEMEFLIIEKFLHYFLEKGGSEDVIKGTKSDYKQEFDGILNGSQISEMNFPACYGGCPARITKIEGSETRAVMVHNFSSRVSTRKIKAFFGDSAECIEYDTILNPNFWSFKDFGPDLYKIQVFNEFDDFLYEEYNDEKVRNYLQFH